MRTFVLLTMLLATLSACEHTEGNTPEKQQEDIRKIADSIDHAYLLMKQSEALAFCKSNGYNQEYCMLLDMSRHSGLTRFYVWDFTAGAVVDSALVSHGCGVNSWGDDATADAPVFSNVYESHCSSLGKYRIGERGWSQWGIHVKYQLYGLDDTNSNASGRCIVLHGWDFVYDHEVFPDGAPEGWGCPAVSNAFMERLDLRLKTTTKPVLMWMYQH
jgi:hypothetical protein